MLSYRNYHGEDTMGSEERANKAARLTINHMQATLPKMPAGTGGKAETVEVKATPTSIATLVNQLEFLFVSGSPLVGCVGNPMKLLAALRELDEVVGVDKVKSMVVGQTRYLLLNQWLKRKPMLHGVFYGPPGVGKTKISKILAKIWSAMGVLKRDAVPSGFGSSIDLSNSKMHNLIEFATLQQQVRRLQDAVKRYSDRLVAANDHSATAFNGVRDLKLRLKRQRDKGYDYSDDDVGGHRRKRYKVDIDHELAVLRSDLLKLTEVTTEPTGPDALVHPTDLPSTAPPVTNDDDLVVMAHRGDVVGEYTGQTVPLTLRFLNKHRGKVIVFDEAYLLATDRHDTFGLEALTTINQWADQHPEANIFFFDGYKEQLQATIFTFQPGLARRCRWVFEIDGYAADQLASILIQQLQIDLWHYADPLDRLVAWIGKNMASFPAFGGDMESFAFFIGKHRTDELWTLSFNAGSAAFQPETTRHVTMKTITSAFTTFNENKALKKEDDKRPAHMYM